MWAAHAPTCVQIEIAKIIKKDEGKKEERKKQKQIGREQRSGRCGANGTNKMEMEMNKPHTISRERERDRDIDKGGHIIHIYLRIKGIGQMKKQNALLLKC